MMKEHSRIRFNPTTQEIEIEGSETFVKTYFDKLQAMLSTAREAGAEGSRSATAAPARTGLREPEAGKTARPQKGAKAVKKAGEKRITQIDRVVGLINASTGGMSTAELKDQTGLADNKLWNIVSRAAKGGKIKKLKRGVYGAA
jgi:hypothetical protein